MVPSMTSSACLCNADFFIFCSTQCCPVLMMLTDLLSCCCFMGPWKYAKGWDQEHSVGNWALSCSPKRCGMRRGRGNATQSSKLSLWKVTYVPVWPLYYGCLLLFCGGGYGDWSGPQDTALVWPVAFVAEVEEFVSETGPCSLNFLGHSKWVVYRLYCGEHLDVIGPSQVTQYRGDLVPMAAIQRHPWTANREVTWLHIIDLWLQWEGDPGRYGEVAWLHVDPWEDTSSLWDRGDLLLWMVYIGADPWQCVLWWWPPVCDSAFCCTTNYKP